MLGDRLVQRRLVGLTPAILDRQRRMGAHRQSFLAAMASFMPDASGEPLPLFGAAVSEDRGPCALQIISVSLCNANSHRERSKPPATNKEEAVKSTWASEHGVARKPPTGSRYARSSWR